MTPEQEAKLDACVTGITRVDERTLNMAQNHEREIRAVHTRIGEVKDDLEKDIERAEEDCEKKIEAATKENGGTSRRQLLGAGGGGAVGGLTLAQLVDWIKGIWSS